MGAGRTGRHLLGAANGRKIVFYINSRENSDVISYVFACNKNKALQLQRVPTLSILGYNIGSLAASGSTLLVLRQFCVGKGGKFYHRPEQPKVLLRRCLSDGIVTNISKSYTHKMAAKISWNHMERNYATVTLCIPNAQTTLHCDVCSDTLGEMTSHSL